MNLLSLGILSLRRPPSGDMRSSLWCPRSVASAFYFPGIYCQFLVHRGAPPVVSLQRELGKEHGAVCAHSHVEPTVQPSLSVKAWHVP